MIRLRDVTKVYHSRHAPPRVVLDYVSMDFPTGHNVGVLGLNGAGKSTLIRLLSGAEAPDSGRIEREGLPSFPLGFATIFHPDLTGQENVDFVCRIYGLNKRKVRDYTQSFAELGSYFHNPVKTYSSGMLMKLAFGLCLAGEFNIYLIDEVTEVGDGRFREKALEAFHDRMETADIILVSHNIDTVRTYCDMGAVLREGQLTLYEDLEEALAVYSEYSATHTTLE